MAGSGAAGGDDLETLRVAGEALAEAVAAALPAWVEASVDRVLVAWGRADPAAAARARRRARLEAPALAARVAAELRAECTADPGRQRRTPLQILAGAVGLPTELLAGAGVPPVRRDPFDERVRPDDRYDLAPRRFSELGDPALDRLAVVWGAAKAAVLRRRRG